MRTLYFCPVCFFFFLFLAYSQRSQIGWLSYLYMVWPYSANLECMSEMCCTRLAGNADPKIAKNLSSGHHPSILPGYIFATVACIHNPKKLAKQQYPTGSHNMVNLGPLTAEIRSGIWGTPANFNGFRVLGALLHGTLVVGVSQTLRRWTEGATDIRQGGHHVGHWPTF